MEEKTLEYYHLKIEQLLTSNESLNQEKSDLQDEAEALQDRINELESHDSMYKEICQLTGTQTNAEHFAKILTDYHKIKPLVSTYRTALEEIKRQFKGCVQTLALFECEKCDDPNCVYLIASKALEGGNK